MRRYLLLVFAAMVLAVVAPSAFAIRVIFDPPTPVNPTTPVLISDLNTPYSVSFVACDYTSVQPQITSGWCLFLADATGYSNGTFKFQFTAPFYPDSQDQSDLLQCSSVPQGLASDNCENGAQVAGEEELNPWFFLLPQPPPPPLVTTYVSVPSYTKYYLITDFINQPGDATVIRTVPEPGALGMFGLGLLLLGAGYGWQRHRRNARQGDAA